MSMRTEERVRRGVGESARRVDGVPKVTGAFAYGSDLWAEGMLWGHTLRSPHPSARIRSIRIAAAVASPGVQAVLLAEDVPGKKTYGLEFADQPVLASDVVRYQGEPVAIVAAEHPELARRAAERIQVDYEVLPAVTDMERALEPDAPKVHAFGNVLRHVRIVHGDPEARADLWVEGYYETGVQDQAPLGPESGLAVPAEDGGVDLYVATQWLHVDRQQLAPCLALPPEKVRLYLAGIGGAFGAREDVSMQIHACMLALYTGKPVKMAYGREESFYGHVHRHPSRIWMRHGATRDGTLVNVYARLLIDGGAYASSSSAVIGNASTFACGPYEVPNALIEGTCVYTNNPPCGAMRGFGANQANFAMEGMMDILAEQVGIDGWEIRWRNALESGERFGTGQILGPGVGLKKTLIAVRDAYRSARWAGIACGVKNSGVGNGLAEYGKAILRPEADGTVTLFHSWTEMGQGCHTALQQIACEELGLSTDRVRVVVDTVRDIETGQCTASRSTVLGGRAIIEAAQKLMAELNGGRLEDMAGREFYGEFVVDWTHKPGHGPDGAATHYAYGWATQVVVLDEGGRIENVIAAHDVGKVINPTLLEGQIEGAVHMGLGHALSEELVVERGVPVTDTLKSLNIIPPAGMPPVECIFIEEHQPEGPYGAKGVGEIGLVPTASAVAGALYAFDGVRRTRLPMKDSPAARAAVPKLAARR